MADYFFSLAYRYLCFFCNMHMVMGCKMLCALYACFFQLFLNLRADAFHFSKRGCLCKVALPLFFHFILSERLAFSSHFLFPEFLSFFHPTRFFPGCTATRHVKAWRSFKVKARQGCLRIF